MVQAMRWGGLVWLPWLALLCCGDEEAPDRGATPPPPPEQADVDEAASPWGRLWSEADARRLGPATTEALVSSDAGARRAAALAVSRLQDPTALPLLRAALRDPDAEVRRNASLGIGAFEQRAPAGAADALLGALAAEPDEANRAAILWDLGRLAEPSALSAFREGMAANEPVIRAAACRGLGSYGLRNHPLPAEMVRRVAARMVDDADPGARLGCAYALGRVAPPAERPDDMAAIVADLVRAAGDEDASVRAMAVRALGKYPEVPRDILVQRTGDADWQVAVQAFRTLARTPRVETVLARALRQHLDRVLSAGELTGPGLHVLLTALDAAGPFGRSAVIHGVAVEAFDRLGTDPASADRDRGLAHCAAAKLLDLGRGWPGRVLECGLNQVEPWERQIAAADIIRQAEGSARERAAFLRRLYRAGNPRVRQAVLGAAQAVDDPSMDGLVLRALGDRDTGVIAVAADAVATVAPRWRAPAAPTTAPVLSIRPAGAPAPAEPAPVAASPQATEIERALRRAHRTLAAADDLEGLQSWISAVQATEATGLAEPTRQLAIHSNIAVRERAKEALEALGWDLPEGEPPPPPNPMQPEAFPDPGEALAVVIVTSRGDIQVELLPGEAPATVARFLSLVREGFYDGLRFHRVVPAFVAQGGDPRGDGYGGPDWSQRSEDNRIPYGRGILGIALAGRDTGGSQFFITHGPQPHLDGRYTAFGRVTSGLEVLDALQEGDVMRQVRPVDRPSNP